MKFTLVIDGNEHEVETEGEEDLSIKVDASVFRASVSKDGPEYVVKIGGSRYRVKLLGQSVLLNGVPRSVRVKDYYPKIPVSETDRRGVFKTPVAKTPRGIIKPPMPGRVISIAVKRGDFVRPGTTLLIFEAMKMQNEMPSPLEGTVKEVMVSPGDSVDPQSVMMVIE